MTLAWPSGETSVVVVAKSPDIDSSMHGIGIVHVWVNGTWQARGSGYLWKTWHTSSIDQGALFITAKHVLEQTAAAENLSVNVSFGDSAAIASGIWLHSSKDLGVLWFRRAFVFCGRRTATRQFYEGDTYALKGRTARCYGYGKAHLRPRPPLKSGTFFVEHVLFDTTGVPSSLVLMATGDAAIVGGDSGGACLVEGKSGQGLALAGIITAGGGAPCAKPYAAAIVISASDRRWLSQIAQEVS